MLALLYGHGSLRGVVSFEPYPTGLCGLGNEAANLDRLSGEYGYVVIVVFEGEKFVAIFRVADDRALEKADVFGWIVHANGYAIFA